MSISLVSQCASASSFLLAVLNMARLVDPVRFYLLRTGPAKKCSVTRAPVSVFLHIGNGGLPLQGKGEKKREKADHQKASIKRVRPVFSRTENGSNGECVRSVVNVVVKL
jgi:hypothetical protein